MVTGGFETDLETAPTLALKTVTRYTKTGEAETLAELNVARYEHACGQFVNDEGVTVRFIYRM